MSTEPRITELPLTADHAAFQVMVREMKTDLDRLQCDPSSRECVLQVFGRSESMRERLTRHFAREEAAWSRREAAFDASTRRWVRLLVEQHRAMEAQLDFVCAQLRASLETETAVAAACDEALRALLRDLTTHELSEDRLFQRSIFEDLDGV